MLRFQPAPLTASELTTLSNLTQAAIVGRYADQVERVNTAGFWSAPKLGTARAKIEAARPRQDRCVYCEDSVGSEIDHLQPKTLHPWLTFCWENLIPACSVCGNASHKGAKDAICDPAHPGQWVEISRTRWEISDRSPTSQPRDGRTAWLNPRLCDPLSLLRLDIRDGTFRFDIIASAGTEAYARARWTVDTLKLNTRANLVSQRRVAYDDHLRWLGDVVAAHTSGDHATVTRLKAGLTDRNHPTVWAEMKRQRQDLPEVRKLIAAAPEVLSW
jgi:hypothetical protein